MGRLRNSSPLRNRRSQSPDPKVRISLLNTIFSCGMSSKYLRWVAILEKVRAFDSGSVIRDPEKTYPGSRGQKGTGSLIRNNAGLFNFSSDVNTVISITIEVVLCRHLHQHYLYVVSFQGILVSFKMLPGTRRTRLKYSYLFRIC
jgi:hypothetical protein